MQWIVISSVVVLVLVFHRMQFRNWTPVQLNSGPWYLYVRVDRNQLTRRPPTTHERIQADAGNLLIYEFFEPPTMAVWTKGSWDQIEHEGIEQTV